MSLWTSEGDRSKKIKLVPFIKQKLAELSNYDVRIYVGTDSQNLCKLPWTGYVTAITFHIGINEYGEFLGNGGQTIFKTVKIRKDRDKFQRLWRESSMTFDVVEKLRDAGILVYQIDLDYNEDESTLSNRLVSAGVGMFTGLGYNVSIKPHTQVASRAADHLIKLINWRKIELTTL